MILDIPKVKTVQIEEDLFLSKNITVYLLREDEIHPVISGNKWRKLRFNIEKATQLNKKGILTFGGAHSNHLHATAEACKIANLKSIGIVRGENIESQTIVDCQKAGMELHFISREDYRMIETKEYLNSLNEKFDYPFIVPQGGDNFYGTLGCTEILKACNIEPDQIFVASGTGNTASGILISLKEQQKLFAVSALKGAFINDEIKSSVNNYIQNHIVTDEYLSQLRVLNEYHFGGFAKKNQDLVDFIQEFYKKHKIKLDPIYTSKMMFALYDQIEKGTIKSGSKVLAIHTGGLQGIVGFEKRYGINLFE
jgi:1-aminocyclopropane-1-carboxylate deaminase